MRMEMHLQVRQEMRMILAPQIIQSIEILQLPLLELRQRIDQELVENPVLEVEPAEEQAEDEQSGEIETTEVESPREERLEEVTVNEAEEAKQFERLDDLAEYYREFDEGGGYRRYSSEDRDAKLDAFENSPAPDPTLEDHLRGQLAYQEMNETLREVCENIVANLDPRGYLAHPLEEIVASMDLEVSEEQAREALEIVQGLEPLGVAARSLEECLLLQLDRREPDHEFLRTLIAKHFEDIRQNRYPKIAREMGCTIEELKDAVEKIGKLNPIPGSLFEKTAAPHVVPDLRIEEVDGEYTVMLENTWLPSLRICAYYARRLRSKGLDQKARDYLRQKLQSAQGLISAIQQRRSTLFNVASEIVTVQKNFFEKGALHLKPLKMQEVADTVGVHVSTVSRAISGKYVQTPQGIYSLKHFFTGGLEKRNGEVESWEVVRQKLLNIVANEDKSSPLSDEVIAEKLKAEGIDIARRTVSKYRKNLAIPPSRLRKEY